MHAVGQKRQTCGAATVDVRVALESATVVAESARQQKARATAVALAQRPAAPQANSRRRVDGVHFSLQTAKVARNKLWAQRAPLKR